jgi:threonine dehydrogenase-like Zn-dependent dehydrogenase
VKALTFQGAGDVKVLDVPKPSLQGSRDALVRVTLGAVCGSDMHILHGHTPMNVGAVLGHEFVGVVEQVGPEVKRFQPGDRVVSSFFTACGHCALSAVRRSSSSCPTQTRRWSPFPSA